MKVYVIMRSVSRLVLLIRLVIGILLSALIVGILSRVMAVDIDLGVFLLSLAFGLATVALPAYAVGWRSAIDAVEHEDIKAAQQRAERRR